VIQEKRYQKVGSPKEVGIDLQFIAATNRDLEAAVESGEFRQDLFYRLNVIRIDLPPLRQRPEDIPLLLNHFLQIYGREYNRKIRDFSPEATRVLVNYNYPGNVRELENIVERCVVLSPDCETVPLSSLPPSLLGEERHGATELILPDEGLDLDRLVADLEIDLIQQALRHSGNNKTRAAELLGLSFRSFRYRLEKYGLK